MDVLMYLIPVALILGVIGLAAFVWSLKSGQYDDLDGAACRILLDDDETGIKEEAALTGHITEFEDEKS